MVVVRELKVLVEGQVKARHWRTSEARAATRTDRAIALDYADSADGEPRKPNVKQSLFSVGGAKLSCRDM